MKEMKTLNGYEIVDAKARGIATELEAAVEELKVSGEYVVSLQDKTVTENGSVTADSGYDGLGTVTVDVQPKLQEKSVTENGEVLPDEGYDGMSKVTVDVAGGSSVDGGFTVNFHNEDGILIESHSAELGRDIYAPASFNEVNYWSDADGVPYTLPLTINTADTVLDLYATEAETCARALYNYFGVDGTTYPELCISVQGDGNVINIYFGNNLVAGMSAGARIVYYKSGINYVYRDIKDNTLSVVQKILSNPVSYFDVNTSDSLYNYSSSSYHANFDLGWAELKGRLDEVMFTTSDRPHPYALQEKTVTEAGEVTPDDGYYGLSKVTVEVKAGPAIDGGYTVNFYDTDSKLIESHSALCGNAIDRPISYVPKNWVDTNDDIKAFPFSVDVEHTIIELYASDKTYADVLYNLFSVDATTYPYIAITNGTNGYMDIIFSPSYNVEGDNKIRMASGTLYEGSCSLSKEQHPIGDVINYIVANSGSFTMYSSFLEVTFDSATNYTYANFSPNLTTMSGFAQFD